MVKKLLHVLGRKRRKEKREKKARRVLYVLGLCCAFCAGAGLTGWFVYSHRRVLAAAVNGREIVKSPHRWFCACKK